MISGFITELKLEINVLVINIEQGIGNLFDSGLLLSALQNSTAGHIVFNFFNHDADHTIYCMQNSM